MTNFSAAPSLLGYLFQVRIALLWALERLRKNSEFTLSIETLDDVTFESGFGEPIELLQTKFHLSRTASLTDLSPDLWKTFRIWFEAQKAGEVPKVSAFHLLTTATAPTNSAASNLRFFNRNVQLAVETLEAAAQSSTNSELVPALSLFLEADRDKRISVLERVYIHDGNNDMDTLNVALQEAIFPASERKYAKSFVMRLEGWWIQRVIHQLRIPNSHISALDIELTLSDIREQFKQDSLPIDADLLDFTPDQSIKRQYASFPFVQQIELTKASSVRITAAIRDYYRAYEQRSRWQREELIVVSELALYEKKLIEEWQLQFEALKDELGDEATEELKQKMGRAVLKWAEDCIAPIRPQVIQPFVSRGSLHLLSDNQRVGWHPDFKTKLTTLLSLNEVAQ